MRCNTVERLLSLYLDEMLEEPRAREVAAHVHTCRSCRMELDRVALLRRRLGELGPVAPPKYLRDLVENKLELARRESWRTELREGLDTFWARVRTTESLWYVTRLAGTTVTFIFFFAIYTAMSPLAALRFGPGSSAAPLSKLREQLPFTVVRNLGLIPDAQRRPTSSSDPRINDLYLLSFGESASRAAADDSFSVVTAVDRSGAAKIENVLEYPANSTLLYNFNDMLTRARCRPASYNGRAVDSHMVMSFSVISVYD